MQNLLCPVVQPAPARSGLQPLEIEQPQGTSFEVDGDLVMWHTIGVTHVPRSEDWPVMPVEYCGFHLIPVGFFDRNSTLDLPGHCD